MIGFDWSVGRGGRVDRWIWAGLVWGLFGSFKIWSLGDLRDEAGIYDCLG